MYISTYLAIILWTFAIFGVCMVILRIFSGISVKRNKKCNGYSLIISAKNQEDAIEGIIRGFILKMGLDGDEDILLNIVLVDAGSYDETPEIMKRLSQEYCFVKFIKPNDLSGFFKKFMGR